MKTKITSIIITIFAVAAGYVISNPLIFQLCGNLYKFNDRVGCLDSSMKSIGSPTLLFSSYLFLVVLVAVFFSENIFVSWLKFATWAVPLSILLIILTPDSNPGAFIEILPFYRDDAARLAGQVFSAISLALLTWKFISTRKK